MEQRLNKVTTKSRYSLGSTTLPRTTEETDSDTESDIELRIQKRHDNATNEKERRKLKKALSNQQKTAEKNRAQRGNDMRVPATTSTVIQQPSLDRSRAEDFVNVTKNNVVSNDTLAFDNEEDGTIVRSLNRGGKPKLSSHSGSNGEIPAAQNARQYRATVYPTGPDRSIGEELTRGPERTLGNRGSLAPTNSQGIRPTSQILAPPTEASPTDRSTVQSRGSYTAEPNYWNVREEEERRLVGKLYRSNRDVEAEREATRSYDNSVRIAELFKEKMKETDAYCSELEHGKASAERKLVMSRRRNEQELLEMSRRTVDLQDECASLKDEIAKRELKEQILLRENRSRTGVTFNEEVEEHSAGPSIIYDGTVQGK